MDAEGLVTRAWPTSDLPAGMPLVVALSGYRDAGQVVPQLREHLLEHAGDERELVAAIDIDAIFDYRARRPIVTLDGTDLGAVRLPSLELHRLRDDAGVPYLLLEGHEPDFRWIELVDALQVLCDDLEISSLTWAHSFAMPVPHTRPIRLSVTGNRPELAERLSVWSPHTDVPAHFAHVLAARFAEAGTPVLGLVALIPHYVSEIPVPGGAVAVLEGLSSATGLMLTTSELREEDRQFRQSVDGQIAENREVTTLIESLEQQHDAYLADLPQQSSIVQADGALPSAEDIALELEQFLARSREGDDGSDDKGEKNGLGDRDPR